MSSTLRCIVAVGIIACGLTLTAAAIESPAAPAQDDGWGEGMKEIWGDWKEWPIVKAGDLEIDLSKLSGIRAMYDREILTGDNP